MKSDREAISLRLLVHAGGLKPLEAVPAIEQQVRQTLGADARGAEWSVAPMFGEVEDDREGLSNFYEISGAVDAFTLPKAAWDLSYLVRDALGPGDFVVEPDLPSSCYSLGDEVQETIVRGAGKPPHLPGSERQGWSLETIRCSQAWDLAPAGGASRGAGILVGHPDTGYTDTPELKGALDLTRDFDIISGDQNAEDPMGGCMLNPGHGSRTASVIASRTEGAMSGVAPLATLVPIRTVKSVAQVFDRDVGKAVDYARRIGCHAVSMSIGGLGFMGLEAAINRAVREGLIVMAAAGNRVGFVTWPALYKNCLAVASTRVDNQPSETSCHGEAVDISAPGESVWIPNLKGGDQDPITRSSGTSYAVAHLAGVAALWLGHHGPQNLCAKYGPARIQAAFMHVIKTSGHLPPSEGWRASEYGPGIVDALATLTSPLPALEDLAEPQTRGIGIPVSRPDPFERVWAVVPELSRQEFDGRVKALLGGQSDTKMERHAAELQYLLVEDSSFRAAFLDPQGPGVLLGPASRSGSRVDPLRNPLLGSASRGLASAIDSALWVH